MHYTLIMAYKTKGRGAQLVRIVTSLDYDVISAFSARTAPKAEETQHSLVLIMVVHLDAGQFELLYQ